MIMKSAYGMRTCHSVYPEIYVGIFWECNLAELWFSDWSLEVVARGLSPLCLVEILVGDGDVGLNYSGFAYSPLNLCK
jgi:hypothetical protein